MTGASAGVRLMIVGDPGPVHVGAHLLAAAHRLNIAVQLCDVRDAWTVPRWRRTVAWRLQDRRPPRLRAFLERVLIAAREWRPDVLIATGLAPIDAQALRGLGALGVRRINYLTDDPWNRAHRSRWFMEALRRYDHVFTPRRANLEELKQILGGRASYLPFAYAPEAHYPEAPSRPDERSRFNSDVVFVGGADRDRIRAVAPLIGNGFAVALYGGYWERYLVSRGCAKGHIGPEEHRKAIAGAKVCLCLVRRANRDGHAMRSFEVPAMGGCMLVEDTDEHRAMFGPEGESVLYFSTSREAVEKTGLLLNSESERVRLARAALARVRTHAHTYDSRLQAMLAEAGDGPQ